MKALTRAIVIDVFQRVIFPGLTGGQMVQIEAVRVDPERSPIGGTIAAVRGLYGWRCLVQDDLSPEGTLRLLLHELGHVVLGHCRGEVTPEQAALTRRAMIGTVDPFLDLKRLQTREYRETPESVAREAEVEAWTDRQYPIWLAVFQSADTAASAATQSMGV